MKTQKEYDDLRVSTKEGHIKQSLRGFKKRAKLKNIPFNLSLEYLITQAPDICPIFKMPLGWCHRTGGAPLPNSPSLDRIVPELGYVEGNVQWVSHLANKMKQNATPIQLHQFADWIKLNIKEN